MIHYRWIFCHKCRAGPARAHRERGYDEVFPWAHLHGDPPDAYLARQYDEVFTQIGLSRLQPVGSPLS